MCYRDDRLKDRTLEIIDLLNSIKIVGPKKQDEDILMELPNRSHLREMIIQRVKADWSKSKDTIETKYAIKREHA